MRMTHLDFSSPTFESLANTRPEDVFTEAAFRMLVASEHSMYVHHVFGDTNEQLHLIEVHESNPHGVVSRARQPDAIIADRNFRRPSLVSGGSRSFCNERVLQSRQEQIQDAASIESPL